MEMQGERLIEAFADFYFTDRVTCDLADGCAIPSLSGEVSRADDDVKGDYEAGLAAIVSVMAAGLMGGITADRESRAWAMVALMSGGVNSARSVRDKALRERIAAIAREAFLKVARG